MFTFVFMEEYKNKEWLNEKFSIQKYSCDEIGKLCSVSAPTISRWLKKHQIKTRTLKEHFAERFLLYGYKKTKETLKRMAETRASFAGEKNSMFGRSGILSPNYGVKRSKEYCEKLSKINKGKKRPDISGEKNPNWKGGKTPLLTIIRNSSKCVEWRNQVYKRDNYTCQNCKDKKGHNLNSHHIKELAKLVHELKISSLEEAYSCALLWDINNGLTLCKKCHKEAHKQK